MAFLLAGLVALVLVLFLLRGFANANPAAMARQLRLLGGVLLMVGGAVLALRGRIDFAVLLALTGWGLVMGRGVLPWGGGNRGSGSPSPGQGSHLSTAHLDMELDHATGAIRGRVLKGRYAGREIDALSPAELTLLWQDYSFGDPESAQVLEAYLDRRHPTWRDDVEREAGGPQAGPRGAGHAGGMTRSEALEILGLDDGADEAAVRAAHRDLMKKIHPDRGGSNYLASKINEAKAVLIGD